MWVVQRLITSLETTNGSLKIDENKDYAGVLMVYKKKKKAEEIADGTEVI